MTEDRDDWVQEGEFLDAGGKAVRSYDDVILLDAVPQHAAGNVSVEIIPSGSRCTVLFFTASAPQLVDLECYLDRQGFAFALVPADRLRLLQRREDKLTQRREGSAG